MSSKATLPKVQYWYVVALTFLGVVIHLPGIFGYAIGDAPKNAHILMFLFDLIVLIGICVRSLWGFWAAVVLYTYGVASQSYWSAEAVIKKMDQIELQIAMAILTAIGFYFLFSAKQQFLRQSTVA